MEAERAGQISIRAAAPPRPPQTRRRRPKSQRVALRKSGARVIAAGHRFVRERMCVYVKLATNTWQECTGIKNSAVF